MLSSAVCISWPRPEWAGSWKVGGSAWFSAGKAAEKQPCLANRHDSVGRYLAM